MNKDERLTNGELEKVYNILKAFDEGLIINPTEDWELDHYDEKLVDNKGLKPILSKIKSVLPKKSFDKVEKKVLVRKYDIFNNQIDGNVYKIINNALNNKLRLEIEYFSMQEEVTIKRNVDIYAIKGNKEIIIECTEGRNNIKWQDKAELLSEISKELKCDVIFVSKQTSSYSKKVLKTRNILNLKVNELMEHI